MEIRSPNNAVLEQIARAYPGLSRTERQVADYVLANPLSFTRTPISRITASSGASAPTILRFCRAAGFSGLTDLKLSMVEVLGAPAPAGGPDRPCSLFDSAGELLDRLRRQSHAKALGDAATLLAGATRITCSASHSLQHAAAYARDSLLRHGIHALTPASPGYGGAPDQGGWPGAAALFFCQGPPDAALVDAMTRYRQHGKGAVVISDVTLAPFAQPSVQILVGVAPTVPDSGISSVQLFAHLLMTDLVVRSLLQERR